MNTKRILVLVFSILMVVQLSCRTVLGRAVNINRVATAFAGTLMVYQLQTQAAAAISTQQTSIPQPVVSSAPVELPVQESPTLTQTEVLATATNTPTATLSVPMVSVSVDTNCRTGPGTAYPGIGALLVGETAEVVGKFPSGNYWIIKNPDGFGECWLWGEYATVVGDTSMLKVYKQPPTPTPERTPTPTKTTSP